MTDVVKQKLLKHTYHIFFPENAPNVYFTPLLCVSVNFIYSKQ